MDQKLDRGIKRLWREKKDPIRVWSMDNELFNWRHGSRPVCYHEFIPDENAEFLEELMQKEENELERKWEHTGRRVEYSKPIDVKELRLNKLAATAPYRNVKHKRVRSVISKHPPERGISQRHVKMSPVQFV